MKNLVLISAFAGTFLFGANEANGHGGICYGPGGYPPPTPPGGGAPTGSGLGFPGGSSGPCPGGTPGPSTPTGGSRPKTPGPKGRRKLGGPGAGRKAPRADGRDQWQVWWAFNKDRFLDLKHGLARTGNVTGNAGFLSGVGRQASSWSSVRLTDAEIQDTAIPALQSMLTETDPDIVDSAILAIARMTKAHSAIEVQRDIERALTHSNPSVKQSAILSLGVLGASPAVPVLNEIVNDTPRGRTAIGETNAVHDIYRSFAAISLGYIGARESVEILRQVILDNDDAQIDVRSSAILALGFFKDDTDLVLPFLMDLLQDKKLERATRAQVPIALSRLGSQARPAIPEFLSLLKRRGTDIRLEESVCVALGLLARVEDVEVQDALIRTVNESTNAQARHFSLISLAQISARATKGGDPNLLSNIVLGFLETELIKPRRQAHSPWAGLAIALVGRALPFADIKRNKIVGQLHQAFVRSNNPSHKACFAVCLGLVNAGGKPAESIYIELSDTKNPELIGYLALSLGMQSFTVAAEKLTELVLGSQSPEQRLQVATSLGLMGDRNVLQTLITGIEETETLVVRGSFAQAIGLIGDRAAMGSLQHMIEDTSAPAIARAFGCVALGLLGEKTQLPWNEPLKAHSNYRVALSSMMEIADIL